MDTNERICRYLAACPPAVSGSSGHNQTFTVACALINGFGLHEGEALSYLRIYNDKCQPPWSESELEHKIRSAVGAQHSKARGHLMGNGEAFHRDDFRNTSMPPKAKKTKPTIDPATAIENFLKGKTGTVADLYEASPIKPSENLCDDGPLILQHLYRPNEIINFVTDFKLSDMKDGSKKAVPVGYGSSMVRDELIDFWTFAMPQSDAGGWMRMNPTDGKGVGDSNITSYRFVLLEFDQIPLDLQVSLLCRIALPITAILTSGGKSIHAWVRNDCPDLTSYKDDSNMILSMLEKLGIDGKNKNPSRLSRLVGVTRKIDARGDGQQRLLYLNPNPEQRCIL